MNLYLNYLLPGITTLGPGRRIGLWVQGCTLRCAGCMSQDLWPKEEHHRVEVSQLFQQVLYFAPEHTGLTVSGGEPFEQAEALRIVFSLVKQYTSLDILVYSGYTLAEILAGSKVKKEMLDLTDMLIDGRYRRELPTNKLWRGSDNQKLHLLSKTAQKYHNYVKAEYGLSRPLQLGITMENNIQIIGIPGKGDIDRFKEGLLQKGIRLDEMLIEKPV